MPDPNQSQSNDQTPSRDMTLNELFGAIDREHGAEVRKQVLEVMGENPDLPMSEALQQVLQQQEVENPLDDVTVPPRDIDSDPQPGGLILERDTMRMDGDGGLPPDFDDLRFD